jgi:hypothetical protein
LHAFENLTPHRAAIRKLIKARYGPWYILRLRSGKWQAVLENVLHHEDSIEAIILEEGDDQKELRFACRFDALKFLLRSSEDSSSRRPCELVEGRPEAMASLMGLLDGDASAEQSDDFIGTAGEKLLLRSWQQRDEEAAKSNLENSEELRRHGEVAKEQKRRDEVFESLLRTYGNPFIAALNSAIKDVWLTVEPRQTLSRPKMEKAGEQRAMPQICIQRGKVRFISQGRVAPVYIRSPLSSQSSAGTRGAWLAPHWQYPEWVEHVVPRLEAVIDEWERRANEAQGRAQK